MTRLSIEKCKTMEKEKEKKKCRLSVVSVLINEQIVFSFFTYSRIVF